MDKKKQQTERDDLVRALFLVLLFFALMIGREIGMIYQSKVEISQLAVLFQVSEENLADFAAKVLKGESADLDVGVALTLPSVSNIEGIVTELPDYVKRWMISVYLSPVVVRQPEVSDFQVWLFVEGEEFHYQNFKFDRVKVPYISLLERKITIRIEDIETFKSAIERATKLYGGELMMTLEGRAHTHLLFIDEWLPFSTTRYPLIRVPHLELLTSKWAISDESEDHKIEVGKDVFVEIKVRNPTRVHSIFENVTITVHREESDEIIYQGWKLVSVAPGTDATYVLPVELGVSGTYFYSLNVQNGFYLSEENSPRIIVLDG